MEFFLKSVGFFEIWSILWRLRKRLHATFGRKLAKLRGSVEGQFLMKTQIKNTKRRKMRSSTRRLSRDWWYYFWFLRYRSAVCTCARADEGTLPMPFVKCIANGHPTTYQISTQSAEPLPSYSNISLLWHPSGGTRHVLLLQFTCNGTSLIHCLKDGATQQRRPLANRTHGSRDIGKCDFCNFRKNKFPYWRFAEP